MVCESLLNFFGTTSEEIIARTKQESDAYYLPKIDELSSSNRELSSANKTLSSQIEFLKNLLTQNNISFDLDSGLTKPGISGQHNPL